jgi:hypothetical protein
MRDAVKASSGNVMGFGNAVKPKIYLDADGYWL